MGNTFCKNDDTVSLQANSRGRLSEGDCTACLVGWQTGSREGWLYKAIPCTNLDNYDNLLDNILAAGLLDSPLEDASASSARDILAAEAAIICQHQREDTPIIAPPGADDKQIQCELIKDINGYINKKWTGTPMTVQEIEQVFGSHS
jgi:hypothetical protein